MTQDHYPNDDACQDCHPRDCPDRRTCEGCDARWHKQDMTTLDTIAGPCQWCPDCIDGAKASMDDTREKREARERYGSSSRGRDE